MCERHMLHTGDFNAERFVTLLRHSSLTSLRMLLGSSPRAHFEARTTGTAIEAVVTHSPPNGRRPADEIDRSDGVGSCSQWRRPMRKAALVAQWVVRLAGLFQIVVGLAFWSGHALSLIPVHIIVGLAVSLGVAVLAVLAWRAGAPAGLALLGVAWALVLPAFGVMHAGILPGPWHWMIRALHLALGLGALRLAQHL